MGKVSLSATNDYCPQTLFVYGTRKADGTPNFGLFCWFSYYWDTELGVMACIGGDKLTKERIHANRIFSANLVTERLLPLADYLGNTDGHTPGKMDIPVRIGAGAVLDVPVLEDSPVNMELEVVQFIPKDDGEVMLCKIRNVLMDEALLGDSLSLTEQLRQISPVITARNTYFTYGEHSLGQWGEPGQAFAKSISR